MDIIEKGLNNIDAEGQKSIQRTKELISDSIYNAAKKSINNSNNFDLEFKKYFPEIENLGEKKEDIFNPPYVCELNEGKAIKMIDVWDKKYGILPDRIVMDRYYIDYNNNNNNQNHINIRINQSGYSEINATITKDKLPFHNYQLLDKIPPDAGLCCRSIIRGEDRYMFPSTSTEEFEVDNYLNLYHRQSGLYLMFNKTSFPKYAFYNKKFIFKSKRWIGSCSNFPYNQQTYSSLDKRNYLLLQINNLIPDEYTNIFNHFDRFRKFKVFSSKNESDKIDNIIEDDKLDTRDKLISSYKIRLREVLLRAENAETISYELNEKYNSKCDELIDKERKILSLEKEIETNKFEFEQKINDIKRECKLDITKITQECDKKIINDKKKTIEIESNVAHMTTLNMSIKTLNKELEEKELELEKIRDINTRLIKQIQDEKRDKEKYRDDNHSFNTTLLEWESKLETLNNKMNKLEDELIIKDEENKSLSSKIYKISESSDNALENALQDKLIKLEEKLEKTILEKKKLEIENDEQKKRIDKINGIISSLKIQ